MFDKKDVSIHGEPTKKILEALCDDLNSPLVLTEMHNLLKVESFDGFINSMVFLGFTPNELNKKSDTKNKFDKNDIHELINDLILARQTARDNKDYRKSDEIRNRLEKAGVSINDLGDNTKWTLKPFFNPKKLLEDN